MTTAMEKTAVLYHQYFIIFLARSLGRNL